MAENTQNAILIYHMSWWEKRMGKNLILAEPLIKKIWEAHSEWSYFSESLAANQSQRPPRHFPITHLSHYDVWGRGNSMLLQFLQHTGDLRHDWAFYQLPATYDWAEGDRTRNTLLFNWIHLWLDEHESSRLVCGDAGWSDRGHNWMKWNGMNV